MENGTAWNGKEWRKIGEVEEEEEEGEKNTLKKGTGIYLHFNWFV